MLSYMYNGFHGKYSLFSSEFNKNWTFATGFQNNYKYHILWKSIHWEVSFSTRMDGQTNRHDEANSYFPKLYEYA
jgi:hypothetical protein